MTAGRLDTETLTAPAGRDAGLSQSQGRRGGSKGLRGTEAARAEPGDSHGYCAHHITTNTDRLAAIYMGDVVAGLGNLRSILRYGGERVSMTRALIFAQHVEFELDYLRSRLDRLNNDQPAAHLGALVDVRA